VRIELLASLALTCGLLAGCVPAPSQGAPYDRYYGTPQWYADLQREQEAAREALAREGYLGGEPPTIKGHEGTANRSGSGFFVVSGVVLTNNHVVSGCSKIVVYYGHNGINGSVIAKDDANDLALVETTIRHTAVATLRSESSARAGEPIVVVGFPLRGLLSSSATVSQGVVSNVAGIGDDTRILQISAPVQPGSSGGPVLDQSGRVLGITVSKLNALTVAQKVGSLPENVNFAIKSEVLLIFLKSNGIAARLTAVTRRLGSADVADEALRYTVALECWS